MKLFLKYFKGQLVHQELLVQLGLQGPPELRICLARNTEAKQNESPGQPGPWTSHPSGNKKPPPISR